MNFFKIAVLILTTTASGLLARNPKAQEIDLSKCERQVFSQQGEDGVIEKIFSVIGTSSKFCVEFGAADGFATSNTLNLRKNFGWQALLLDQAHENTAINLRKEFITKSNINKIFEKYRVPRDVDFLSIDIDFNDFHVWQAIDRWYQPRLVVIEYNATHKPDEDKVVHYDAMASWDGSNYFGASALAMYNLGRKKGYSLVYADNMGVNLFFIRDDLVEGPGYHFKNVNDVAKLYKSPRYGSGPNGGHRSDPLGRSYLTSQQLLLNQP